MGCITACGLGRRSALCDEDAWNLRARDATYEARPLHGEDLRCGHAVVLFSIVKCSHDARPFNIVKCSHGAGKYPNV